MDSLNKTLAQLRREQMKRQGVTPPRIQKTKEAGAPEANGPSLAYRVAVNKVLKNLDQEILQVDALTWNKQVKEKNLEFDEVEKKAESIDWTQNGVLLYAWSLLLEFSNRKYNKEVYKLLNLDKATNNMLLERVYEDWATQQQSILHRYARDRVQLAKEISIVDGQKGTRYSEHKKNISGHIKKNKKRLNWVLDDEMHRLDGDLDRRRQTAAGVDSYTWITRADSKVRPKHAARHGGVYFWDDPPPGGHPKSEAGCRCFASPNVESLLGLAILPFLLNKEEKEE